MSVARLDMLPDVDLTYSPPLTAAGIRSTSHKERVHK
jgi:hypothetical protein